MISVETALDTYFPGIKTRKFVRPKLLSFLKYICHESEINQFQENNPHLEGFDFVEAVLNYFDFSYRVLDKELENIPASGRVVIVANHPIGSLDGLALLKLVSSVRRDVKAVANEILYSVKPQRSLLLPVDNMGNRTPKENIKAIHAHLEDDGALIIFPAGEVSRFGPKGIRDGKWSTGFLRFAKQSKSPVLPMFIDGRNSLFFYALSLMARPISTLWLVREMFKQAHNHVDIRVGHLIDAEQLDRLDVGVKATAKLFKKHVYKLAKGKPLPIFSSEHEALAHPENKQALKDEIRQCDVLGETSDGLKIVLYDYHTNSIVMREIARLRELTFHGVKEGTGKRRDMDLYDHSYEQLVLWDEEQLEIAGAYRMRSTRGVAATDRKTLYTQTLFDLQSGFQPYLDSGLELGRSFVQPAYQGRRSLDYLWYGIGAYLNKNPDIRYLFGPVSISQSVPDDAKSLMIKFYAKWFGAFSRIAVAKTPYLLQGSQKDDDLLNNADYQDAFRNLRHEIKLRDGKIPPLYKQYTELCEERGVQFAAFNVDPDFSNCVDGLILVDLHKIKMSKRKRYLNAA